MYDKNFLNKISDPEIVTTLTICGDERNMNLMQNYQAYYTIQGNVVHMPVNYNSIRPESNRVANSFEKHDRSMLKKIHNIKITNSDGIIVVINKDKYIGADTLADIKLAFDLKKQVIFTRIENTSSEEWEFNYNRNFPLYILKDCEV